MPTLPGSPQFAGSAVLPWPAPHASHTPPIPMETAYDVMAALADQGRYLDALKLGRDNIGEDLSQWTTIPGQRIAMRLASRLGGDQLANVLRYRFTKQFANSPEARFYTVQRLAECRPLARVWLEIRNEELDSSDPKLLASWLILKAKILECFRDFDLAHQLLDASEQLRSDGSALRLARVGLFAASDRMDDAVNCCCDLQKDFPQCSMVATVLGAMLTQTNHIDQAIEVLEANLPTAQYGGVATQLISLHQQRKEFARASEILDGIEKFFPLADPLRCGQPKAGSLWANLAGMRSEIAYVQDNFDECAIQARRSQRPFLIKLAECLENFSGQARRTELKIPFQKQAHMTCAPATLSMLAGFWKVSVDHDAIAQQICYEGTSAVDQRLWAEANGFVAREFRCAESVAHALIDHGVPFAITTTEADSAHIQVVCGYDNRRGVLLIQDPNSWYVGECQAKGFLDAYSWTGPRALVLVPKSQAHLLSEIELPESTQYDWLYQLEISLRAHHRSMAVAMLERLRSWDSEHRLTWWAQWLLAGYDNNSVDRLDALNALSNLYPDTEALLLRRAEGLASQGQTDQCIALLRSSIERKKAGLPSTLLLLSHLSDDCDDEIKQLLHRVLLWSPTDEFGLMREATRLQRNRQYGDAYELLRLASTSAPMNQTVIYHLLHASERFGRQSEVLAALAKRFNAYGHVNAAPGLTYARALAHNLQFDTAVSVLRAAIAKRPDDGSLLCNAAELIGRLTEPAAGLKLLNEAQTPLPQNEALQVQAALLEMNGQLVEALDALRSLPRLGNDECELAEKIARLTSKVEGIPSTIRYLQNLAERYPHHAIVQTLTASWISHVCKYDVAIEYLNRALAIDSTNAWAWRERAIANQSLQRYEKSLEDASRALELEKSVESYQIRADSLIALKRLDQARSDFQAAIGLSVDASYAMHGWLNLCDNDDQRRQALEFIKEQWAVQPIGGDGLDTYYSLGKWLLTADEMEQSLRMLRKRWPNALRPLTLLSECLRDNARHSDAISCLWADRERFDMLAAYWNELGCALWQSNQTEEAIVALQRAFGLEPSSARVAERLVQALLSRDRRTECQAVLDRALANNPNDSRLLLLAAEVDDEFERKIAHVTAAVHSSPDWERAWESLEALQSEVPERDLCLEVATSLVNTYPGAAVAYSRLGQALSRPDQNYQALEAIQKAIQLDPTHARAHRLLASRLARQGQIDLAVTACLPAEVSPIDAYDLRCYAAEILFDSDRKQQACEWLYETIKDNFSQPFRWTRLADMAEQIENHELYAKAVDVLYEHLPNCEVTLGYYHVKFMHSGQLDLAEKHLRKALILKPSYDYAFMRLTNLLKSACRFNEAEAIINEYETHVGELLAWEARLAVAIGRKNWKQLNAQLRSTWDTDLVSALHRSAKHWDESERQWISNELGRLLSIGQASELMGIAWIHASLPVDGAWQTIRKLTEAKFCDGWSMAAASLCSHLQCWDFATLSEFDAYALKQEIRRFIEKRHRDLSRHVRSWSQSIWAACGIEDLQGAYRVAKWFTKVPNPDSCDLHAGLAAAIMNADLKLSASMIQYANVSGENNFDGFKALAALHFAYLGDFENVTRLLISTNRSKLAPVYLPLLDLIGLALEAMETGDISKLDDHWQNGFDPERAMFECKLYDCLQWYIAKKHLSFGQRFLLGCTKIAKMLN